jgi:threonine aldolase
VSEAEYAACADTVTVTLSKGLGCPVGSLLCGDDELMQAARTVRRRLGGGMRQVGILAAAGLYALEHHRGRLADDHHRAGTLARLAAHIPGLRVIEPETNIVLFDIVRPYIDATALLRRLAERGVLMTFFTHKRIRAVTHLDVDDGAIQRAAAALAAALA